MKKKSVKPQKLIDIQCPRCGRVTHHYLNKETGEYKCVVCQSVNKTIKVREVVFKMDADLDTALNPVADKAQEVIDEILNAPDADKLETADGTILDDQGNPV